ncbi:restriction endonuclease subunit S [Bifidobacterium pseudolongum]|uniref:restriction endonuclease subunit S n=2 Tax=Bifidobacterium pseudolongum TaxID=1694 RepID=UPI001A934FB3|nr:restriction endonuclease subunit S [Bifidobacterium pseudolongum]
MSDYITDGKGRNTMDKKIQPKLRFRGFTDAWEPRKLKSLLQESTQTSTDKEILSVTVANGIYPAREGARESNPGESLEKYKVVHENDIVYNSMRLWQGAIAISHYEGIVSPAYTVCIPSVHINPDFISYLLKRPAALRMFYSLSQGNSKDTLILKYPLFSTIKFSLPAGREQYHIARLLRCVDQLIDAEKRKLHLLQERKRSLLKGIFNRTIRFEGFTGVWKQQKLKDEAISISAGGDIDREKLLPSGRYPVIGNALSNNGIIGYYANDYEVKGPAVTVTGRGEVGVAKAREMNFTPVVRLLAIKSLHDSHFLECAINLHRAPLESTGVPQLTIPIISNYKLLFPPTLMEEMSIGLLFKHIDSLIAAVFLKIELLNLKKQSLLQQMFV